MKMKKAVQMITIEIKIVMKVLDKGQKNIYEILYIKFRKNKNYFIKIFLKIIYKD